LIEDDFHGEEAVKRNFLLLVAHLNMALCHLKLGNNLEASHACDEALKLDNRSEKAYYRRALVNSIAIQPSK
jgi:FK506-binding protein 4/5